MQTQSLRELIPQSSDLEINNFTALNNRLFSLAIEITKNDHYLKKYNLYASSYKQRAKRKKSKYSWSEMKEYVDSLPANYDKIINDKALDPGLSTKTTKNRQIYCYYRNIDGWDLFLTVIKTDGKQDIARYELFNKQTSVCYIRELNVFA